jgi:hypothetical protein
MICSQCNKEFAPSSRKHKYCSKACGDKNYKQSEKGKKSIKKYNQSDKRKATDKRFNQSDKGKISRKRTLKKYMQSDKAKISIKRSLTKYQQSSKGKEVAKKHRQSDKAKETYKKYQQTEVYKNYIKSDKKKESIKKYQQSTKGKNNLSQYNRNRRKTDPIFKLIKNARSRLSNVLKSKNIRKPKSTIVLFGCTPEFLKKHLEKQFYNRKITNEPMTWKNHTLHGWHVDHKDPLDLAMTSEDIVKLSHYTNLQPMWSTENWKKNNKVI